MRFVGGFLVIVAAVLGLQYLLVDGDEEAAQLATQDIPTPPPTPTPTPVPTATPVPTPTPTPSPTPSEVTVTVAFSGEVLSHGPVISQARADGSDDMPYDYRPMFAEVAPLFDSVDFAVCHVETPVSSDNTSLSGYPIFNAPREMPAGLKASGYDACSTASNHSYDKGAAGVESTVAMIEEAGLQQTGMARTAEERDTPTLYEIGDLTLGHLSYTYSLNGFVLPSGRPYLVNVTTVDRVLADAQAAKEAGADLVALSIQWGNEYQVNPSQTQIDQATAFLESEWIDFIVGAHVHVVQPVDIINDKVVFYGVGNFLSNQSANCCPAASQNGIIVYVDITGSDEMGWTVSGISFTPTRVDRSDYTIVPLPQAIASGELDEAAEQLYESVIVDTTEVLERRGVDIQIRPFGDS